MNAMPRSLALMAAVIHRRLRAAPAPAASATPDTRATDEAALRALIKDWSAAAHAKDATRFVAVYADDAVVMMV